MLTKKIAHEIVKETSLRLQRNVNIMDINGVIIATQDRSRIGLVHEGALEVLKNGKTLIIRSQQDNTWEGAQPGVNLPIVFQEKIIGVIGVTGDPDQMEDIGELVKMTTELMIKQEFIASQMEWKQRMKDMVIEELLKRTPSYSNIDRGLSMLQLDFHPPFMIIILQTEKRSISNQKLIQKLEDAIGSEKGLISFININRVLVTIYGLNESDAAFKVDRIFHTMKKTNIVFKMAYSIPFEQLESFNQSYLDCDLSLKISKDNEELVSFANIEVKSFIYQLHDTLSKRFSERVLINNNKVRSQTLNTFFSNDLHIQKAADKLYVHRNTLIYRLNKIAEETGYDPRKFEDALNLQVALWIAEKTNT